MAASAAARAACRRAFVVGPAARARRSAAVRPRLNCCVLRTSRAIETRASRIAQRSADRDRRIRYLRPPLRAFWFRVTRVTLIWACAALALAVAASAQADTPLRTGIVDPYSFPDAPAAAFAEVRAAGAGYVRIIVRLDDIAPRGATKPASFDPTNPGDPGYSWSRVDAQVQQAAAAGLVPILCLFGAPAWARDPSQGAFVRPSSVWFGKFAEGIARRYSGSFGSLPRVRYWQAWNEPNLGFFLMPQRGVSGLISPELYRRMVNAFSRGVKRVHADNLVIAGGLAPYSLTTGDGIPPLTFMKQLLCVTGMRIRPRPRCLDRVRFDIWSMHPYTWGGPTHTATTPGDLAMGDMPAMKSVLDQAVAAKRIVTSQPMEFWVTEFSWDTNPIDPGGVPMDLQTRWTAEALYRMWLSGVSLVTWWLIRDQPFPERWQSGLYYNGGSFAADSLKPTLEAFRFPTVGFVEPGGIRVWCRTPAGAAGLVTFEQDSVDGAWVPLSTIATDGNGIATALLPSLSTQGSVRARYLGSPGETSNAFSLTPVPDQYVNPFGD
jgi:hypothetical protein